jgi:hypothetical protein
LVSLAAAVEHSTLQRLAINWKETFRDSAFSKSSAELSF